MAEYIPFAPNVEVNGETVLATINSFPEFMRAIAFEILDGEGIRSPQPGFWYKQIAWLNSFKKIAEKYGSFTLFEIGKQIPATAKFPADMNTIEKGLKSIDVAYHLNHRNGEIGFYKFVSHDTQKKRIVMHCKNPYPCDFDRGIITAIARKFETFARIELQPDKPSRKDGADDSWYVVTY